MQTQLITTNDYMLIQKIIQKPKNSSNLRVIKIKIPGCAKFVNNKSVKLKYKIKTYQYGLKPLENNYFLI